MSFKNIIYLYYHWHPDPWNAHQIIMERCFREKRRDKNNDYNRLVFIFPFRDNLITIWLWCFYLFCFLFSRACCTLVYFCLPISTICLQLRRNLIFYLSNTNLLFSRRLSFFSVFSSSSTRNWLHVNLSFSWKVFFSPPGYSVALISGAHYLFIQRDMVVMSIFPVLWKRNSSALL